MKATKIKIWSLMRQQLRTLRTAPGASVEEVKVILAEEERLSRLIDSATAPTTEETSTAAA